MLIDNTQMIANLTSTVETTDLAADAPVFASIDGGKATPIRDWDTYYTAITVVSATERTQN